MNYPTKEKILEKEITFKKKTIRFIRVWKKTYFTKKWKKSNNNKKIKALIQLLEIFLYLHKKPAKIIKENEYKYDSDKKIIFLEKNNPSIISTLHELAHHLFGDSETQACRWSIWLFRKTFKKQYNKLEWNGHMLIEKNETKTNTQKSLPK